MQQPPQVEPMISATLDHNAIAELLPHSGRMCLLESVSAYDSTRIFCTARNHQDNAHPLRHADRLPITAGIEYAAQAMALHAMLTSQNGGSTTAMLVQLSNVSWTCDSLDHCAAPLSIRAEQTNAMGSSANYRFTVLDGETVLIEGQILVHFHTNVNPAAEST